MKSPILISSLIVMAIILLVACNTDQPVIHNNEVPIVTLESSYEVLSDLDIVYADGLSHSGADGTPVEMPQRLDIYSPDNNALHRPVFMFVHGGGFQGGTKTKPEIVDMGHYFASRGWVFVSVDYRTTSDFGGTDFRGIAPQDWIDYTIANASTSDEARTSIAMYAAQRDAKAALRWIVANEDEYKINPEYITVGGASAGGITTIALGISDQGDFRDEIPLSDDPTLNTTNLTETYTIRSMIDFWGGNVKLELFDSVYGLDRFDADDPELFIAHGTLDPTVLYAEATELDSIYQSLGIYCNLVPLEGEGHGPWNATVDDKSLAQMVFDFITDRQSLSIE